MLDDVTSSFDAVTNYESYGCYINLIDRTTDTFVGEKSLAKSLNTRIEMRQIGVRDKARLVGGIGCCGRELCCQSFLQDFEPVSVRMAKDQNLPPNPSKISGVCGRLMCCLTFEHATYKKMSKALPKCGKKVRVGSERGKVTRQNPLEGTVVVELEGGKEVEVGPHDIKND